MFVHFLVFQNFNQKDRLEFHSFKKEAYFWTRGVVDKRSKDLVGEEGLNLQERRRALSAHLRTARICA